MGFGVLQEVELATVISDSLPGETVEKRRFLALPGRLGILGGLLLIWKIRGLFLGKVNFEFFLC